MSDSFPLCHDGNSAYMLFLQHFIIILSLDEYTIKTLVGMISSFIITMCFIWKGNKTYLSFHKVHSLLLLLGVHSLKCKIKCILASGKGGFTGVTCRTTVYKLNSLSYLNYLFFFFFFFFFLLFRAVLAAYGSAQARGQIRTAHLYHSHGNTRSLTHCLRPGIELCPHRS